MPTSREDPWTVDMRWLGAHLHASRVNPISACTLLHNLHNSDCHIRKAWRHNGKHTVKRIETLNIGYVKSVSSVYVYIHVEKKQTLRVLNKITIALIIKDILNIFWNIAKLIHNIVFSQAVFVNFSSSFNLWVLLTEILFFITITN